jgi:hypothetical protein
MRMLRAIVHSQLPTPHADVGEPGVQRLLPLSCLVVDDRYQRSVAKKGRANIVRILANFDWRKFTPVIVTPVGNGKYAIIDGQHRATAALMHPSIDMVPCWIIKVTPEEAASCFAAINGQVTTINRAQIFQARVAAKEPDALALQRVLKASGVKLLKHKEPNSPYRVGETLAIGTLERCMQMFGPATLTTALQAIVETGSGNAGCVTATLIRALCEVLHDKPEWREAGSSLLSAMDELDVPEFLAECAAQGKRSRQPIFKITMRRLIEHFSTAIQRPRSVKAVA